MDHYRSPITVPQIAFLLKSILLFIAVILIADISELLGLDVVAHLTTPTLEFNFLALFMYGLASSFFSLTFYQWHIPDKWLLHGWLFLTLLMLFLAYCVVFWLPLAIGYGIGLVISKRIAKNFRRKYIFDHLDQQMTEELSNISRVQGPPSYRYGLTRERRLLSLSREDYDFYFHYYLQPIDIEWVTDYMQSYFNTLIPNIAASENNLSKYSRRELDGFLTNYTSDILRRDLNENGETEFFYEGENLSAISDSKILYATREAHFVPTVDQVHRFAQQWIFRRLGRVSSQYRYLQY